MVYLISFLELFVGILCYFYDFIRSFKVSLHLGYCIEMLPWCWTVYWYEDLWLCCRNGLWCDCIARRIWNYYRSYSENLLVAKCLCDATGLIIWYIVYVGPWVFGWKSLKTSRKTLRCGCMGLILPLGMSPKRHRVWLALGWCPKIVIHILIVYQGALISDV